MNNKRTKTKTAILGGIAAISLLSPLAHADIIFFDDFSEDTGSNSSPYYTAGLAGTYNNLTYAPAGAPTNKLNWTSTPSLSNYAYQYGAANVSSGSVGYGPHTTASNGSPNEVYLSPGGSGAKSSGVLSDITTPILTSTGSAVNLLSGASYTLSLNVGDRTDQTMSTLGIDIFAGSTLLDPSVTIGSNSYTDEVTLSQLTTGKFTSFTFTLPASALAGDSGALSIEFVNLANQTQVNLSDIVLSDTPAVVPEPGAWAMLLGGLGTLFFFQRMRRGHKV